MEKKDWEQRLEDFYFEREKILPDQSVGIDIDDWKEFIQQELDRAMEEGYEECKKDMAVGVGLATDTELPEIVSKIASKLSNK